MFRVKYQHAGTMWNLSLPPMTNQAAQGYALTILEVVQPLAVRIELSPTTARLLELKV